MSSKNFNSFKDFQSDQLQTSSRKLFTAHHACSNSDLNLTLVTGRTNGFIFQIINSLIESWGGNAWPIFTVTQKYYYEITWLFFRIVISFFFINLHSLTHSFDQDTFIGTTQMHPFAQSLFLANVRMVPSVPAITAFCLTSGNISIAMIMNGRIWMRKTTRGLKKCIVTWLLRDV